MKIGIDARYLENEMTGVGRYSHNLLRAILHIDSKNLYHVFLRSGYHGALPQSSNARYHYVPYLPISVGTILPLGIHTMIQNLDLFHSHFPVAPLVQAAQSVVTVHDLQPLRVPRLAAQRPLPLRIGYRIYYPLLYRTTLFRAKAIIAVSNATRCDLEDLFNIPRERIHVIHEAIDERFTAPCTCEAQETIRSRYNLPEMFLLYVGATLPHKNLPTILKGYARAVATGSCVGLSLVLAGRRSRFDPELEQLAQQLGIETRIQRLGYVPEEDLPALYTIATALLYVTRYEGFGFPPLEAMYHGLPVIASYHAALPEVIGACGVFVDPDDIEGIAEAILTLVHSDALRNRLATLGRSHLSRFSWHKAAMDTIRIYEEVYTQ